MDPHAHSNGAHEDHRAHLNPYLLGAVGAAGAVTLAPYALPLVGIGSADQAATIMHSIGGHIGAGTGLAGGIQAALGHIPLLGPALTSTSTVTIPGLGWTVASGTLATLAATATIGIGGVLFANWLQKREDPNAKIHWSKVIRYASLATSALIALPSIISGLSVGVAFLALAIGGYSVANWTILGLQSTLGATSMTGEAASGILGMTLPHLLTCGAALMPLITGMFLGRHGKAREAQMELVSASPMERGKPCELGFRLVGADGKLLTPDDLDTKYTQKLHTMVIDHSLTDYHHLHPRFDGERGLFICSFVPQTNQPYRAWHDYTLHGADTPTHQKNELPRPRGVELPPSIPLTSDAQAEGLHFHIAAQTPLVVGKDGMLEVTITDAQGQPVRDLQPIMGAFAHLAGFSRDGEHFIHCHPMEPLPSSETDMGEGRLVFHIHPDQAGPTKFFLQVRREGKEITAPFGQYIKPQEQFSARHNDMPMQSGIALA